MTRYEFAVEYAKSFGFSESLISKGTWHFQSMSGYPGSQEGLQYKMDSFNIESYLGVEIPTIKNSIQFSFQKYGGESRKKSQAKTTGIRYI
jgi:dTDP-4-dehydrorhamnose reductase